MSRFRLHCHLMGVYMAQFIKSRLEYKADFLLGLSTIIMFHGVSVFFIDTLFTRNALTLNGWSKYEVLFIYGFSIFPLNLFFCFFSSLYMFANKHIIEGQFDRILLRPLNTLFQVLLEKIDVDDLFGIFVGIGITTYASVILGIEWSFLKLVVAVVLVLSGVMIYGGIFIALAALSFWWPDRMGFMPPVFNMIAFGKYPVEIYSRFLQFLLMWIVPFAFVAFFPSTYFLDRLEGYLIYVILTPVVAIICFSIGLIIWSRGVAHYESTGS